MSCACLREEGVKGAGIGMSICGGEDVGGFNACKRVKGVGAEVLGEGDCGRAGGSPNVEVGGEPSTK